MLRDGVSLDFTLCGNGVHLDFLGILHEFGHNHRVFLRYVCSEFEEALELVGVRAYIHRGAREHIAGAHKHRIAYLLYKFFDIGEVGELAPAWLVDSEAVEHGREFVAVFGAVDTLGSRAEDIHTGTVEARCKVVGNLAAHREYHAVRILHLKDIHHALVGKLVEIESVADIVVGRYCLGVVVDHHRAPAFLACCKEGVYRAPVKLYGRADTVSTRAEHHHRASVALIIDIVLSAVICEIEVVGGCRIFGREGIYLLHHGHNAESLAVGAHLGHKAVGVGGEAVFEYRACNLEVAEALLLGYAQKQLGHHGEVVETFEFAAGVDDIAQFIEEPFVDFREIVDLIYRIALHEGLGYDENAAVGRLFEGSLDVGDIELAVFGEAVHALPYHSQAFLDSLLESAADSHHLAD